MLTKEKTLPSYEELECQELDLSTPFLKAGSFQLGKQCEAENNEFMLCRMEEKDPRKCLKEGKVATACAVRFFQAVKRTCAQEFTNLATCLDKGSHEMTFERCRNTQAIFDGCMRDKLGIERPPFGYFTEVHVHNSTRPRPEPERPPIFPDALGEVPGDEIKRHTSYQQGRPIFF